MQKVVVLLLTLIVLSVRNLCTDAHSSCLELLNNATKQPMSGVYTLHDSNGIPYLTYCDMIINRGGWTLIASIHENNIEANGHCTQGDRWSSQQENSPLLPRGENTWANMNTFGNVVSATSDDYKNPGYFDIDAGDLMIWQVPNETPLNNWRKSAYLRYRTENRFLDSFGDKGNLYSLYKVFPVESGVYSWPDDNGPSVPVVFDKGSVGDVLHHFGPNSQPYLTPGYIQFRHFYGFNKDINAAYALCPGVKVSNDFLDAPAACIGSTGYNAVLGQCGDFASMAANGVGTGVGLSVDKLMIETTFMLFYR